MEPFQAVHGMRACMLAPTKIIAGLGMSLGIERLTAEGATGKRSRVLEGTRQAWAGQSEHGVVAWVADLLLPAVNLRSLTACHHGEERDPPCESALLRG